MSKQDMASSDPANETTDPAIVEPDTEATQEKEELLFLTGLSILPPLQKQTSNVSGVVEGAVALPPIRAEEPVGSLRAALSEVKGYAHFTNYRFVLDNSSADAALTSQEGAGKTKKNKTSGDQDNKTSVVEDSVVSPFTGPNAVVCVPSGFRTLDSPPTKPAIQPGTALIRPDDDKAEEIVLDDFGDLSPLLEKGLKSGSSFRIVLERYDAASVRDHVSRVRSLLDGNAPSTITLHEETPPDNTTTEASETKEIVVAEADSTDDKSKQGELRESARKSHLKEVAGKLPTFPLNSPITVDGKDLPGYYYLACGEEEALGMVRGKKSGKGKNTNSQTPGSSSKSSKKKKKSKASKAQTSPTKEGETEKEKDIDAQVLHAESARRLNELDEITKVQCAIRYSGFHPPAPNRRLFGDLAYLEVCVLSEPTLHITVVPTGFYVNRTSGKAPFKFNPAPAANHCFSHALLDCLLKASETLKLKWTSALVASKERAELLVKSSENDSPLQTLYRVAVRGDISGSKHLTGDSAGSQGIDSVVLRPSWLVPLPSGNDQEKNEWEHNHLHSYNPTRAEESLTDAFGLDIRGGALRDWNEEVQSAREMPTETLQERIDRARMIHKVLTEFGEAAVAGARAIFEGHVMPMNGNEPNRSHVFLFNNIFFSRALDAGVDTFKISQGDRAARKSASRDAQCVGILHRLDNPGLHTLATVLVDYLGTRLVCQSIVPGILHGEKTHKLLYGAVEATAPLSWDEDMHSIMEDTLGTGLMIATRKVPTLPLSEDRLAEIEKGKLMAGQPQEDKGLDKMEGKEPTTTLCGPVEAKGIRGSDQRKYVLDLTRLTARDANWVPKSTGGTGKWEEVRANEGSKGKFIPVSVDDEEWTMAVLRQELVTLLTHKKMTEYITKKKEKEAEKKLTEAGEENQSAVAEEGNPTDAEVAKKQSDEKDIEYLTSLRFNVNVFLPHTKSLEGIDNDAFVQMQKDEELAREAAAYLWETLIPKLTVEIREGSGQIPVDGLALTELLHQRGINCRYLGRIAALAATEEAKDRLSEKEVEAKTLEKLPRRMMPTCWLEMLECEMVARAAKHVLDSYLNENGGAAATQPAQTIASFLSALVSTAEESAAETECRVNVESTAGVPDEDDLNALTMFDTGGLGDATPSLIRSRSEVWEDIEKEVGRRFRYVLTLYNKKGNKENRAIFIPLLRRVCQRTGVRLLAKNYFVGGKCLCSGGNSSGGRIIASHPITALDLIEVLPMVKHSAAHRGEGFVPCSFGTPLGSPSLHILLPDAKATLEAAHVHFNQRSLAVAMDLAQESASLYQRVIDTPLHASVARCLDLTAVILFHAQEPELAVANASRALAIAVQLGGFDCSEAVTAHTTLSHILLSSGGQASGVKHLRAALFLMELMAGPNYTEIPSVYHKLGTVYQEAGMVVEAIRFYQEAASRKIHDRAFFGMISKSNALVLASLGNFAGAFENENRAHGMYRLVFGADHEVTKNSANTLKQLIKLSIEQNISIDAANKQNDKEQAADEVANQIVADEIEADKKKKKQKSKKKKHT